MEPPALDSLPHFGVRVEGEDVIVSIPEDESEQETTRITRYNPAVDDRTFAIIGSGAAGNVASEALRQSGFEGRVAMITREGHLPYDRTDLSKGYIKNSDPESPAIRSEEFYSENDIELLMNHNVVDIDLSTKTIEFNDNPPMSYDKLLLATGSTPRRPDIDGVSLNNIMTLRSLDDANRLRSMVTPGAKLVIVGASFIGMEVAGSLSQSGADITIVAPESVPFERTLGSEIGGMYRALHEENGISFRLGTTVSRFEGNGNVSRAILGDGSVLAADAVLLGTGVTPATGFLKSLDLNPDGSLSVDDRLRVTEDVYAAGDIASFVDSRTGEMIRIEHWRLAEQHGRVAAQNMAGKEVEYRSVPYFWTNQLGVNLGYAGYVREWDDVIIRGDLSERNFAAFYVKDNKVMAVAAAGDVVVKSAVVELMRIDKMPAPSELKGGSIDMVEHLRRK
jgi:NADPH-dependent 2,4-dienoyl-CoA reductase/sulfur reductase-like enzyme